MRRPPVVSDGVDRRDTAGQGGGPGPGEARYARTGPSPRCRRGQKGQSADVPASSKGIMRKQASEKPPNSCRFAEPVRIAAAR